MKKLNLDYSKTARYFLYTLLVAVFLISCDNSSMFNYESVKRKYPNAKIIAIPEENNKFLVIDSSYVKLVFVWRSDKKRVETVIEASINGN